MSHHMNRQHSKNRQRRITIKKARLIMGKDADKYTDEEIKSIVDSLYGIAQTTFHNLNLYTTNTQ